MKKLLLIFSIHLFVINANAQKTNSYLIGFNFAAGVNLAFTPPDILNGVDKRGFGIEAQPEYIFSKRFSLYGSAGYTILFYKDYIGDSHYERKNANLITLVAGPKFYVTQHFYIGTKAGLGFITGDGTINEDAKKSGFDIQPQIGYTKNKIQCNFAVNVLANDNVNLSIGILHNFK